MSTNLKQKKPKSFTAGYTVDLEDIVREEFGAAMAKAIDEELIKTVEIEHLVGVEGWTKVVLPRFDNMMHAVDVNEWVEDNCGLHDRLGSTYVFKEAKDATWFRMRWCSE